ncbi:MAG: hypothetical protein K2O64_07415 [Lactobacillus sp.]|nr:hypothetical protein [Lactobacillus sp.]
MKFKQTLQPHTDDNTYLVKDSDKDDIDDTRKDTKEELKKLIMPDALQLDLLNWQVIQYDLSK